MAKKVGRPKNSNKLNPVDLELMRLDYVFLRLTIAQIAAKYSVCEQTVYNHINKGKWKKTKDAVLPKKAKRQLSKMASEKTLAAYEIWKIQERQLYQLIKEAKAIPPEKPIPHSLLNQIEILSKAVDKDLNKFQEQEEKKKITTAVNMNIQVKEANTFINPWSQEDLKARQPDIPAEFTKNVEEAEFIEADKVVVAQEEPTKLVPTKTQGDNKKKKKQKRISGVIRNGSK